MADLLSRPASADTYSTLEISDSDELYIQTVYRHAALNALSLDDVATCTARDEVFEQVTRRCTSGWQRYDTKKFILSAYWKLSTELSVDSGVLFRGNRAVNPEEISQRVLQLAQEGHLGIVKMRQRLRDCVWWLGINN